MSNISDNGKKSADRSFSIEPEKILAMYDAIMPLLSNNPEELDITDQVNKRLLAFVQYDSFHYLMDTPSSQRMTRLDTNLEKWEKADITPSDFTLTLLPMSESTADAAFDAAVERNQLSSMEHTRDQYPDWQVFDYYRIESREYPRIAVGFFRYFVSKNNNPFTLEEKCIFEQLSPHIFHLFRAALHQVFLTQNFQYFDTFTQLGSRMANDHGLSDAEVKLIPDILVGYTNEEIAERQFISVSTVKSHIGHILKKTGTKNRVDFLSKFFTSPERVSL